MQGWAGIAQALFAFVLIIAAALQVAIYRIMRRDGIQKDRCFVISKELRVIPATDHVERRTVFLVNHIWENSGNTPTRDLTTYECWSGQTWTERVSRDYIFPVLGDRKTHPLLIGPKGTMTGAITRLTLDDLIAIQKKSGISTYGDGHGTEMSSLLENGARRDIAI